MINFINNILAHVFFFSPLPPTIQELGFTFLALFILGYLLRHKIAKFMQGLE